MKEERFFAEEIEFEYPGEKIGKNEIDEIDDFPGREDFIEFYTVHNGMDFIMGVWFIPESCYDVSVFANVFCDEKYIDVSFFLPIRVDDKDTGGFNIDVMRYLIEEKYENFEDFVLFHIPFACDVTDNPFWIDIQTGEIKYIDFEVSSDPDDVITVASSFKEFCKCIRKRRI